MVIERSNEPEQFSQFELEGWQTLGTTYESHFGGVTRQAVESTLDAANIQNGMRVLDVCCGPGRLAAAATKRGAHVVGLDFSTTFLTIARTNAPDAEFVEGDAQAMEFEDDSFDAVVCGFGLMHLPDPSIGLQEMRRVLKPGGRLSTTAWHPPADGNGYGLMMSAIQKYGDLTVPLPHAGDAFQFGTNEKMTAALSQSSFRDITIRDIELAYICDDSKSLIFRALESAVRTRALLNAQSPSALTNIQDAVAKGMQIYTSTEGGYRVPMPIVIGTGIK